jgi:hypothetical protein
MAPTFGVFIKVVKCVCYLSVCLSVCRFSCNNSRTAKRIFVALLKICQHMSISIEVEIREIYLHQCLPTRHCKWWESNRHIPHSPHVARSVFTQIIPPEKLVLASVGRRVWVLYRNVGTVSCKHTANSPCIQPQEHFSNTHRTIWILSFHYQHTNLDKNIFIVLEVNKARQTDGQTITNIKKT